MPDQQRPAGTQTRPATRYFFRYPTRFSFGNHRVAGNPKHRVLPNISGKPEDSGTTIPHICHFFYTGKIFGEQNLHRNLHSKLPIYTVNCQFFALPGWQNLAAFRREQKWQ